ncbi:probable WRKY transcription factor protein 1 isoform X3 [Aphidius gifuensis]|uniref:probable WRKY transcription factor protein 1 isoform X3 n=1 Tax=Aphidius gifuensis TaxID=684658 RepID=UPI001CDD86C3|nr:probable WRKY transcription factor protein 1 isoform X3 [Aphidius gifuensis]XP_044009191.1 probable WRKY transcription factor protein 1 isoform X3 [Aphidius gifuensis]XP_044009192.1 probable WRKY transcription factor protein 1 isoform X3 [Aphidius gifuensis]
MLACVYPSENFNTKAAAMKHGGKSKKKLKLLSMKEHPGFAKTNIATPLTNNELPVGGGGAVLVLSELESMAARQQREIAQQRRLLEQREARLAVLRNAQNLLKEPAQQERLARLRHRLDQQQSKLNRLRVLRSQTDQSRANNATLTSDLDCIRALFNEKEKELSLAVAKVEELTRQLEDLRGRHNGNAGGQVPSAASAELEKLRRELMYRNKMNEQQNQVVSQQRLVLAQRQAEMTSIDSRIAQLQGRLQRKRALNQRLLSQQLNNRQSNIILPGYEQSNKQKQQKQSHHHHNHHHQQQQQQQQQQQHQQQHQQQQHQHQQNQRDQEFKNLSKLRPAGNVAAIEPYSHIPNDNDFNLNKNDPKYQTLPYNTKFTVNLKPIDDDLKNKNNNKIQHSQSASQIGQRTTLQQLGHQIVHSQSQSHIQGQSQILGINQSTQQQSQQQQQQNNNSQNFTSQSNFHSNSNNNNNNSNSNSNNNDNNIVNNNNIINNNCNNNSNSNTGTTNFVNDNQVQNTRLQQTTTIQQKQQLTSSNISSSLNTCNKDIRQSITQNHNHINRNIQIHQKPVSSVAPSFSVKSPIYQTSSTKIHPVMPQTLSMIGRNHSTLQNQQQLTSTNTQTTTATATITPTTTPAATTTTTTPATTTSTINDTTRQLNYQQQGQQLNQTFKNITSGNNTNYQNYQSQNINQNHDNQIERLKYNNDCKINQDRFDINKHEQMRYDNNQIKLFDNNKNEQQRYEQQSLKLDTNHINNKFDHTQLPYGIGGGKHDHDIRNSIKFESQQQQQQYKQQQFKQTQEQISNNNKHDCKLDNIGQKYDVNQSNKHDHATKLEPPIKLSDNDRKAINFVENKADDKMKPALPPKPVKPNPPPRLNSQDKSDSSGETTNENKSNVNRNEKEEEVVPPIPTSEPPESPNETTTVTTTTTTSTTTNHQIIKARPLTFKKGILSDPRLRYSKSNVHVSINRRIEMPPAFLFPETEIPADLMQTDHQNQNNNSDVTDHTSMLQTTKLINNNNNINDKLEDSDIVEALNVINIEDKLKKDTRNEIDLDNNNKQKTSGDVIRRKKGNLKSTTGKVNLSRRVSFDPLALLLDASLEGELELVKKTAKEVTNPSAANDEGITALHNAICAGHLDIVKFLVEFGCDVNAQDSDGWTPLHCAASCNNLPMVIFLVEHGACIFATTLSDQETAAVKCEEDEEGFDGCSEYLYSVQEKLGIMYSGKVYAVFDYEAQHNDELSLKNGDQLIVLRKGDDNEREWWWSKLGNREGYVPRNLLGMFPRVRAAKTE